MFSQNLCCLPIEQTEQNHKFQNPILLKTVQHEVLVIWSFIKRDIPVILSPIIFTAAAWDPETSSIPELLLFLGRAVILFGLFLLLFCISNQLVGIEEDKINKPDRPLVTGMISPKQAWIRWIIGMVLLSCLGWWCAVLQWVSVLQVSIVFYDFGGWGKHWLGRTILLVIIAYSSLVTSWTMVIAPDNMAWQWILILSISFGLLINIQELRDLAGDGSVGRITLPIVIGEMPTRIILCIGFAIFLIVVHFVLMMPSGMSPTTLVSYLGQVIMSCLIMGRLILYRSPDADEVSYQLTSYLYILLIVSGVTIL